MHTTHVHLENVAVHRVAGSLLGHGSWGKWFKQLSAPAQSSPTYLHSFCLKWSWRLDLEPPSITFSTQYSTTKQIPSYSPSSILQTLDLSADHFPGSYLYLAKRPGKTAPPTEIMSTSSTKSLESQEEGGKV